MRLSRALGHDRAGNDASQHARGSGGVGSQHGTNQDLINLVQSSANSQIRRIGTTSPSIELEAELADRIQEKGRHSS
jgi:hypothetical protein